jgi:hypothetical protein
METKQNDMADLVSSVAKAQAEMKNANLNKVNPHFKSKYADLAAIRDAVVPAMSKHGVQVSQFTDIMGDREVVRTELRKGEAVQQSITPIIYERKNAQQYGSALTYARRQGLAAIACISAEEDDDGNAVSTGKQEQKQQKQATQRHQKSWYDNDNLKVPASNAEEFATKMISAVSKAPSAEKVDKVYVDNEESLNKLDAQNNALYCDILNAANKRKEELRNANT